MNNFTRNYEKILETLQSVENKMNFLNQHRKPRLSDIELIAIDLTSEFLGIDSERDLFRKLPDNLTSRVERSVYNQRNRGLFYYRELLRKYLVQKIGCQDYYIVDSMPLEVCKLSRSSRSFICKEDMRLLLIKVIVPLNQLIIMVINFMLYAPLMVCLLILTSVRHPYIISKISNHSIKTVLL